MQVWEAHRDLSLAIGDSCNLETLSVAPGTIPSGARFLKTHRDSALYRAMITILMDAQRVLHQVERKVAAEHLHRLFPNLVTIINNMNNFSTIFGKTNNGYNEIRFLLQHSVLGQIFSVLAVEGLSSATVQTPLGQIGSLSIGERYPIPIKQGHVQFTALRNAKNIQRPDLYCEYFHITDIGKGECTEFRIVDAHGYMDSSSIVEVFYIPYPTHPATQNPNGVLTIEPAFIPKMISLATMFLLSESQDLESSQFLANTLGTLAPVVTGDK